MARAAGLVQAGPAGGFRDGVEQAHEAARGQHRGGVVGRLAARAAAAPAGPRCPWPARPAGPGAPRSPSRATVAPGRAAERGLQVGEGHQGVERADGRAGRLGRLEDAGAERARGVHDRLAGVEAAAARPRRQGHRPARSRRRGPPSSVMAAGEATARAPGTSAPKRSAPVGVAAGHRDHRPAGPSRRPPPERSPRGRRPRSRCAGGRWDRRAGADDDARAAIAAPRGRCSASSPGRARARSSLTSASVSVRRPAVYFEDTRNAPTRGGHSRQEPTSRARPPRPAWSSPHDLDRSPSSSSSSSPSPGRPRPAARGRPRGDHLPARRGRDRLARAAHDRQDPARERAPARGRRRRQRGGRGRPGRLAPGRRRRRRGPLHARPRHPPGLHGRAGGRGPGGHARRHGGPGRRPGAHQPAGAGRPGHRPLGPGRPLRHRGRVRLQRRPGVRAQRASATSSCAGRRRRSATSGSCRPGTGIVHQVNLEYLARGGPDRARWTGRRRWPSRTRSWAPTRTPP